MAQTKSQSDTPIATLLTKKRKFTPPEEFAKRALANKVSVTTLSR